MIKNVLYFASGAVCGFTSATIIFRQYYKRMLDEEVKSVMDWAKKKREEASEEKTISHGEAIKKVEEISKDYKSDAEEEKPDNYVKPYCITPEEFETSDEDYQKSSLDYYLEDESLYDGEIPIRHIDDVVGSDNLVRLHGDVDIVYVRNENTKIDYEVVGVAGRFGVY